MASQYELNENRELDDTDIEIDDSDEISDDSKTFPQEDFNIASRERVRAELQAQIEAFLAGGGRVNEIPSTASDASRPSKVANYVDSGF